MKEGNINGSPLRGSPVRTHVERRVKLNDTFIKSLKRKNKLYSYGDSEMVGLRLYVEKTGTKTYLKPSVRRERERTLRQLSPSYAAAVKSIDAYLM